MLDSDVNKQSESVMLSCKAEESDLPKLEWKIIGAPELFDEIPNGEVHHYPIVDMVVYDEYDDDHNLVLREVSLNLDYICSKQLDNYSCDAPMMICRSMGIDFSQPGGEHFYATQVFDELPESDDIHHPVVEQILNGDNRLCDNYMVDVNSDNVMEAKEFMLNVRWDQLFDPGIIVNFFEVFVGIGKDQMDYYVSESEIEMLKDSAVDYASKSFEIQSRASRQLAGIQLQAIECVGCLMVHKSKRLEEFGWSEQNFSGTQPDGIEEESPGSIYVSLSSYFRRTKVLTSNETKVMLNSVSIFEIGNMLQFVNAVATKNGVEIENELGCSLVQYLNFIEVWKLTKYLISKSIRETYHNLKSEVIIPIVHFSNGEDIGGIKRIFPL
ncbi:hypothetical protein LIER_39304 [Lithospermum erythrorhizon]|uniref:Uncharacterized protein n=1 Tax=Lithospermum erythrorhizon TaxID=34254 RepID=A0AAV3QCK0_LITER